MMMIRSTGTLSASALRDALVCAYMYISVLLRVFVCTHSDSDVHAHIYHRLPCYTLYCTVLTKCALVANALVVYCCTATVCYNTGDSCEYKHELCTKCEECDSQCAVKKHWWRGKTASCKCTSSNKNYDDKTKRLATLLYYVHI